MFYKYYRTGGAKNWTLQIFLDDRLKIDRIVNKAKISLY